MSTTVKLRRKAKGERPYFFADPNVDKVIAMVMGLAGEVAVMRDRLDTVERLLERTGALQRAEIEQYRPDALVTAERTAWREAFLAEVLRIVEIEVEALATGDQAPYDSAIALVEEGTTKKRAAAKKSTPTKTAGKRPVAAAARTAPARSGAGAARAPAVKAVSATGRKKVAAAKARARRR
jgi:hypothetical protein